MKESIKLTEELSKILFLAGVENSIKESFNLNEDNIDVVSDEKGEELSNPDIDSIKTDEENLVNSFSDYLKTKEDDYLNFPMKYAMVSGDADRYIQDVSYLFMALKKQNKSLDYIINTIAPDKINQKPNLRKLNLSTDEFIKLLENNYKKNPQGELDKILKLNKGDELNQYQDTQLKQKVLAQQGIANDAIYKNSVEGLKRDFATAAKDEKSIISYKFSAPLNSFKLSTLGFWQIQFLSRIIAGKPKDEIEKVIFDNSAYPVFYNKAYGVLRNFYSAVIFPTAVLLTGRQYKINPNDHEFLIMLEVALDKVMDKAKTSYNTNAKNFGAWALTVAKNAIIDQIKGMTDYNFQATHSTLEAFDNYKLNSLYFKKDMSDKIPEESLKSRQFLEDKGMYFYEFNSPYELFNFLQSNATNQSVLKSIASPSKKFLNSVGALHSVKKFADVWPNETGEEQFDSYAKKAFGKEKESLYKQLYDFYKSSTKISFDKKDLEETKEYQNVVETEEGEKYRIYTDEELQEAFERDMGKALYFGQAKFAKDLPVVDQKIPDEAINAFIAKYVNTLPESTSGEQKYKSAALKEAEVLRKKNKGDILTYSLFFKNSNINKGLVDELEPYTNYKYKEARDLEKGVVPFIRNEFFEQQKREKNNAQIDADAKNMYPKPIYTFKEEEGEGGLWQQIGNAITEFNLNKASKDEKRKKLVYTTSRENALIEDVVNFKAEVLFNLKLSQPLEGQQFFIKDIEKIPLSIRKALIETQQGKFNPEIIKDFLTIQSPGEDVVNYINSKVKASYIKNKKKFFSEAISTAFNVEKTVKEMLASRRPNELRRLSKIFSKLSGFNIMFENKDSSINEINDYLLEIKNNFVKKILI